ncbi:YobA family protein [Brevibacillus humidisoli]|uniref:DUF3221 domain-containing protein n=1 Tax=Brevibacillus humidisoli TaxID=2895522 RepID=UPI001E4B1144|nr:DUF3221 domain-containing protein [Brevibacillus humidisoli]UFJ42044.1 YobA family protein [Brevibacillus humidisoli]
MSRKALWAAVILAAVVGILAFFLFRNQPTSQTIDIRGTITEITQADNGSAHKVLGAVLIEGRLEADTSYDKAQTTIVDSTRIMDQNGNQLTLSDLRVGQKVEATFTGPVAESYPVQATAEQITVLP